MLTPGFNGGELLLIGVMLLAIFLNYLYEIGGDDQ